MSFENDGIAIEVEGAGKSYRMYAHPSDRLKQAIFRRRRYYTEFEALEKVDFRLRRGEAMGIVGVNGAGKSTLLQLIAGTVQPSRGSVRTRGRVAALLELGSGFNPEFTGRENIYLNAATLGLSKREIDERLNAIIEFSGVGPHIDQPVKTYSSGMYVRLAFSIATSVDPDVLIIDEALSVGDGAFRRRSFDRIMQIKEGGTTILFCSHSLYQVEVFCDRALWLHRGRVQQLGKVHEVLRPYQDFLDAYANDINALPFAASGSTGLEDRLPDATALDLHAVAAAPRGEARIQSIQVRLDGKQGTELHGVSLASRLEVDMAFVSDPSLPTPSAALVLSSESGKILGSCLSVTQGVVFERGPEGAGVVRVAVDRIPLNRGRYRVGVYLFCERGIHGYGMLDPAAHINLDHVGAEQGAWLLNGAWGSGDPDSSRAIQ
jgi:lipopolysaccharide transport system ATP-binding protein